MKRRDFLAAGAAAATTLVLPPGISSAARRRPRLVADGVFDCGVMAGLAGPSSATLWTHVGGLDRSGHVRLEIARDEGFSRIVHRRLVQAERVRDYTARTTVARGLDPGERYWYRFETAAGSSPVGRFTTARPAGSRETVRIGV